MCNYTFTISCNIFLSAHEVFYRDRDTPQRAYTTHPGLPLSTVEYGSETVVFVDKSLSGRYGTTDIPLIDTNHQNEQSIQVRKIESLHLAQSIGRFQITRWLFPGALVSNII